MSAHVRRVRRMLLPAFTALALLPGVSRVAAAHTVLVRSEPVAGSHAGTPPSRVRLVFSEALEPALARIALTGADSRATSLVVTGDPQDVHGIIAPLHSVAPGAYRVTWRVVSADGHPVEGSFVFFVDGAAGVAEPSAMPPEPDARPAEDTQPAPQPASDGAPLLPALLRGLALASAMALAGVLLFVTWPGAREHATPMSAGRFVMTLGATTPLLLGAHAAAWLVDASADHRLTAETLSAASGTSVGHMELWRLGLSLLALWALALARRPRLALPFAAGALIVSGASGHPAAISPLLAIPSKSLHLLAGAAWLGGLLWLCIIARAHDETGGAQRLTREASRVSAVALGAVLLVSLSGVVQTALFLASPFDLVRSAYGAIVLAKSAGLIALVAFGAYHRYRVLPRLAQLAQVAQASAADRLAVTMRRELAVMGAVILLGGLLSYTSPPAHTASDTTALVTSTHINDIP